MCLYKLAEKKILPKFQRMDFETISWIERQRPDFGPLKNIEIPESQILVDFLNKAVLKKTWFANSKIFDGIHGKSHLLRVVTNCFLLSRKFGIERNQCLGLMVVALVHDIRRKNDQSDIGHGLRASIWLDSNKNFFFQLFDFHVDNVVWQNLLKAVEYHEKEGIPDRYKDNEFVRILRAADALDRYRLPKIKWWINDTLLPFRIDLEEKSFAFDMIVYTERALLQKKIECNKLILEYLNKKYAIQ